MDRSDAFSRCRACFKVRRNCLLEDATNQLLRAKRPQELRKPLRVQFVGAVPDVES